MKDKFIAIAQLSGLVLRWIFIAGLVLAFIAGIADSGMDKRLAGAIIAVWYFGWLAAKEVTALQRRVERLEARLAAHQDAHGWMPD